MSRGLIDTLSDGLLCWYDFGKKKQILCIGDTNIGKIFEEKGHNVVEVCEEDIDFNFGDEFKNHYDYIIAVDVLSYELYPHEQLIKWRKLLKNTGKLLLGLNNRLGLRFFCGDRDPFTNRNFDGIENYRYITNDGGKRGRYYSKDEIEKILDEAGYTHRKFYTVLPSIELPQLIYAHDYLPNEDLSARYFPRYNYPKSVFLEEKFLYKDIIQNNMFHQTGNAYLIECSLDNRFNPALHVTTTMDRGRENALATIIKNNGQVEKKILYKEQKEKLYDLHKNMTDLEERGIDVIQGKIVNGDTYIMPYVEGESALEHLKQLFFKDKKMFEQELDRFVDILSVSSEHSCIDDDLGVIMKKGYYDLVPINALYKEGTYIFYDQEFCIEGLPLAMLVMRTIDLLYTDEIKMENELPKIYLYEKYEINKCLNKLKKIEGNIYKKLRHTEKMKLFLEEYEPKNVEIYNNRQKVNHSLEEYKEMFIDIFYNIQEEKIIVFGAGNYAKQFLQTYKYDNEIKYIVDNDQKKWGKNIEGFRIENPEVLIRETQIRVIICMRNYIDIVHQLNQLGVNKYCIYNPQIAYKNNIMKKETVKSREKKYVKGYIAGVFDLFHRGHLNLIKAAKEQCQYLVVGVVSDEGVKKYKRVEPMICEDDRVEIVRACKYVDEVFILPLDWADSMTAHKLYKFNCQFSGSDYEHNKGWLQTRKMLKKEGADLVFLPYTQSTSSTKLKEKIRDLENKENTYND